MKDAVSGVKRRVHSGKRYAGSAQSARYERADAPERTVAVVKAPPPVRFNTRYRTRSRKVKVPPLESASLISWKRVEEKLFLHFEKLRESYAAARERYTDFHRRLCEEFLSALERITASIVGEISALVVAEGSYPGAGQFVRVRLENQIFAVPNSLFSGRRTTKKT